MKRLIILGALWALAVARPELYKEKEDFQFSRSSSDDGSKSGFYGAQRGNMGGNFERAHNMDSLAQNQMSGLVRQVQGELGDGAKTRTGSVYTAASSRGTYGSGHFDLSNLEGRNFQEGTFYDDSKSRASQSSSAAYNAAGYSNSRSQNSRYSGYQAVGSSGLNVPSDDLQSLDHSQGTGQYDYGRQSSHSSGYNTQSGYQQHSAFDTSNSNSHYGGYGSNAQTRLISATPVRIIVRPGTRVAIPVAAQTYDISQGSLVDHNSLNSEAEILSNDNQRNTLYRPGNAKHYESSYNYRKEWEKHDTVPSPVTLPTTPTENPFPKNSELYEDSQARTAGGHYDTRVNSQRAQSSKTYGGFNVNSATGQSSSDYDTQHHGASLLSNTNAYTLAGHNAGSTHQAASSDSSLSDSIQSQYNAGSRYHSAAANSNSLQTGYNTGFNADLNSQVENLNAKPKSYQSSYSYHKSWEHQGDPYVIKPASSGYYDGQSAQRLTTGATKNQAYTATGSHYQHSHQSGADCDENGHIRVARSYNTDQYQNMQQQSQNIEDLGQQVQDFGQQTQNQWGQQSQNTWDNLEDLSQQSHNQWDNIQKKWDRFEDLGQIAESSGGQKPQNTNNQLQDLEQKPQNDLEQHIQDIEVGRQQHVVQQVQDKWDFSNRGQHGQEYYQNQDYHYERAHKLNHQENKQDGISVWNQVVNGGIEQKPHNSSRHSNKSSQFESHNVNNNFDDDKFLEQLLTDTQQTYKISGTNEQTNTVRADSSYLNFFPKDKNSFQIPDKLYEFDNGNIYSSIHKKENSTNSNSYAHVNTFQRIPPNTAPLLSLWNKLDNIEQQSTLSDNGNTGEGKEFSQVYSSQNSYQNSHQKHKHDTHSTFTQYHYNPIKPQSEYQVQANSENINKNNLNYTETDKENSQDLGRGDIGPEDVSDPLVTSVIEKEKQNGNNTVEKLYPLHPSLLSVSGLPPVNSQIPKNENNVSNHNKNQIKKQDENFQQQSSFNIQEFEQKNMQSLDQANSDQRHDLQNFEQEENLGQQNLEDFEQHANVEQQNLHDFSQHENAEQQILEHTKQEHLQQNLQDFGQQVNSEHFEQQENLEQQNLQNFRQHEILEQQNLQDFGQQANIQQQDFGKHENLDQQNLQDFGQHENLEQQNLQDLRQHANLHKQDIGNHEILEQQNLQDFGQQQQGIGKHENLEQQNLQDFGQQANLDHFIHHENLQQQNLQDFGQQANLQDFGQQENLEQQNLQNFGQHEILEQQNLQDFGQQANIQQQDIGKHDNLEQQNLQDFGQEENLEQQNLQNFGKHENLEQHNLQDFGQQTNLDHSEHHENLQQQNLQDFGQQANLDNFGQQENVDQQNLKNYGLHENLEQQNIQNFGVQSNLGQQNLEHIQQQENVAQQNPKNLEQYQNSNPNFKYTNKLEQTYPKNNMEPQINSPHPKEVEEPVQVKNQSKDSQSIPEQSQNTVGVLPIEPVTEKPGFWKSVGNKFSDAKSKIASWFKS